MDDFLYSVEREFDLPVDILWAAWTDPVALEAWYHPTDLTVVPGSVVSDPVEGGAWSVAVDGHKRAKIRIPAGRLRDASAALTAP